MDEFENELGIWNLCLIPMSSLNVLASGMIACLTANVLGLMWVNSYALI